LGLFQWLAILSLSIGLAVILESLFHLSSATRTVVVLTAGGAALLLLAWFLLLPLLRLMRILQGEDPLQTAAWVGQQFPNVQDRLLNILQIQRDLDRGISPYSPQLIEASLRDLWLTLDATDFSLAVNRAPVLKSARLFLATLIPLFVLAAVFPTSSRDALARLSQFRKDFTSPARFILEVSPGSSEVVKNDDVPISVRVRSSSTGSYLRDIGVDLLWRPVGQSSVEAVPLHRDSADQFKGVLRNLRTSTEYLIRAAEVQSPTYVLTVLDRPVIRSLRVRLEYPAYTRISPRIQEEFVGDVSTLPGTLMNIAGLANKPLRSGELQLSNGSAVPLHVENDHFSASLKLLRELSYHILLRDQDSLTNLHPVNYQVKIVPDEYPTAAILQPGRNLDVTGAEPVHLMSRISDDFGFSRLRLAYRLSQSRYEQPAADYHYLEIPMPESVHPQADVPYVWNISSLHLVPEDVIEYYAEVFDNDFISGPKSTRSRTYLLRLPSLDEIFAEADTAHSRSLEELQQAAANAQQLKEKLESIQRDMKKNRDIDWQQRQKAADMRQQYQRLQEKLNDVQRSVDQMLQQMQQQQVLSPETLEKYLELQQLFQELNSSELQEALKRLQLAMQSVNRDQIQQALQQLQFSEDRFRQSIERTLNLLKRIQIEQRLDELRKRTQELTTAEQELQQQTTDSSARPNAHELSERQQDLKQAAERLEQKSHDLQHQMEEFFTEMPAQKLSDLNQAFQRSDVPSQIEQAASQLRSGQKREASSMQRSILQHLSNFSEGLQAVQEELLQQQFQHTLSELRRATNDLLELSKREEQLKDLSRGAPPNSPQLRQNAQDQLGLQRSLGRVIEQLSQLSQRTLAVTPQMGRTIGKALGHMQQAMQALELRNGTGASQQQTEAMGALNGAAMQMQSALQALMQGGEGPGGSLLQQLQGLAGQQMTINLRAQELAQQEAGQRAAQAARLAAEQELVRKSLDQLNEEAQTSAERQRLLGDLEKITEEMREVVRDLEQNDVSAETMQRQERILSRLLDASRSMRERDYERRRTSRPGTPFARQGPGELDESATHGKDRLQEDLLKALEQGYTKDYEELIRRYFEALQKHAPTQP